MRAIVITKYSSNGSHSCLLISRWWRPTVDLSDTIFPLAHLTPLFPLVTLDPPIDASQYSPAIGQLWSRDLDTGLWLAAETHMSGVSLITGSHRHHHQDLKYCGKYKITFRHYFTQTAKNVLSQGDNGGTTTLFFSVYLIVIVSFVRSIDFFTEPSLYWDHLESLHHWTMAALTGWHGKL